MLFFLFFFFLSLFCSLHYATLTHRHSWLSRLCVCRFVGSISMYTYVYYDVYVFYMLSVWQALKWKTTFNINEKLRPEYIHKSRKMNEHVSVFTSWTKKINTRKRIGEGNWYKTGVQIKYNFSLSATCSVLISHVIQKVNQITRKKNQWIK